MRIVKENCMACGMCSDYCVHGAIQVSSKNGGYAGYEINPDLCYDCGACLEAGCPGDALVRD